MYSPMIITRPSRLVWCAARRWISTGAARWHRDGDDELRSTQLREEARRRIAEVEARQQITPNTSIGLMERAPGGDVNATSDDAANSMNVWPKPFPPFPGNVNPATNEVNGPTGPEPTRFGDWERKGRCSDF